jgi:hypothetical protein
MGLIIAILGIESVISNGRPPQCFFEYFKQIEQVGIVWVIPHFTDKATRLRFFNLVANNIKNTASYALACAFF